ncbi:retrovirus-related pol polyprotein from transposon TNT 1-94 [Tanacetum coccineum]|uniref:Retrovirus-related pol polyprotein from transposon TNT 1-94 n=1 Tax=Tanacetum coccineum TaxID=301880 RepID=A0ABQ4XGZ2_9ASTR
MRNELIILRCCLQVNDTQDPIQILSCGPSFHVPVTGCSTEDSDTNDSATAMAASATVTRFVSSTVVHSGISPFFGNITSMEDFIADRNPFGGNIPDSLGHWKSLKQLSCGVLPTSVGNLSDQLSFLCLGDNQLFGSIPSSIGPIPTAIGNLSLLIEVDLDSNLFEGQIPSSLGNCKKLNLLNLADNRLSGKIPTQLLQLSSLTNFLDLSRNSLSGSIPSEIEDHKLLRELDLSYNNSSGNITSSLYEIVDSLYQKKLQEPLEKAKPTDIRQKTSREYTNYLISAEDRYREEGTTEDRKQNRNKIGMNMLASKGNVPDVQKKAIALHLLHQSEDPATMILLSKITTRVANEIVMLKMVPETPLQFGVAERLSRTFRVESTRICAEALKMLWADSVSTTYLIYRIPYVLIGLRILEEEWRGKDISLAHLKAAAQMKCDTAFGIRRVTRLSEVEILHLWTRFMKPENDSIVAEHGLSLEITQSPGGSSNTSEGSENSRSFEDSGRSDEEYSKDGASSKEGGSETPQVQRSTRESRAPVRYSPSTNYLLLTENGKPDSYLEALSSKESVQWNKVVNEEMVSLEKNQACFLVRISAGKKASQRLWMFKESSYVGALNDTSTQYKSEDFQLVGQEENLECRLKEIMYGLIQAPRLRYLKFDNFMQKDKMKDRCSEKQVLGYVLIVGITIVEWEFRLQKSITIDTKCSIHLVKNLKDGDEIEVEVLRSFNCPPGELITEDGVLPERGYSQFNDVSSGYLHVLYVRWYKKVIAVALLKGRWFEVYRDYLRRRAVKLSASKWEIVEL